MINPLISVIIPTYNRVNVLFRAIESVLSQTYRNFDLWIVDDGSNDSTEKLVNSLIESRKKIGPKIYYIKIKNSGVSAARNVGIQKCQGEWVAFLDSDDEWLPQRLELQVEFIKKNPQIPLVHGEEIWVRKGKMVNAKKKHQKSGGNIFKNCLPLCLISPSASIIQKKLLCEMGGFNEDFFVCEDYDLWLKITSLFEVGFIADPIIVKYGGHQDQLSSKYYAMDFMRVKALLNIFSTIELSEDYRDAVLKEVFKKCDILMKGYFKHQNQEGALKLQNLIQTHLGEISSYTDCFNQV